METERTRDEEDGEGRWKRRGLGMKKTEREEEDGNRED